MTRNEQLLQAVSQEREDISSKSAAILEKQAEDNRELTEEETKELAQFVKNMKTLDEKEADYKEAVRIEKEILRVGGEIGAAEPVVSTEKNYAQPKRAKSLGEQFVESDGYKRLREKGFGGNHWSTGQIELKTLLTEDAASGGDLILPDQTPGIVETLFERLTIADLMASGTTTSNAVNYMKETTATNSAAAVLEGGLKPESALVFDAVSDPVRKIATILPVTDEMLEDVAQIQSYINQRLSLFVKIQEEAQLLAGDGTAPNISGILDRTGLQSQARGSDTNEVAIFKALNKVRTTFLEPDAIVIHPDNYTTIRLAKDSSNQYYGGGPFYGPYGGPQGPASGSYNDADPIWGKRVVVTSAITANTALVGAFRTAAQVFRRSGLTVEASNSHDTYFAYNKTAIRAEERLALAVYREAAFCKVTSLN